jgi:hypothetical protein
LEVRGCGNWPWPRMPSFGLVKGQEVKDFSGAR